MRNNISENSFSLKSLRIKVAENFLILGKISFCALLVAIVFFIRIPMAYRSFWAEDGNVHLFNALINQYPVEVFQDNFGGYWNVTSRLIARAVILFPIDFFTYVNFLLICFVMGLVVFVVYDTTSFMIRSRSLRLLLSASIPMLPIARFDVIATSVNLHYYLLFALLLVLISTSKNNEFKFHHVITIVLGALSDPLTIFCMIVLLPSIKIKTRRIEFPKYTKSAKLFGVLAVTHSAFTGLRLSEQLEYRQPEADHSIVKTGFLFLDRVLGSTFVPGWGEVSSVDMSEQSISSRLLFRFLVGISILIIWLCIGIYVKRSLPKEQIQQQTKIVSYLFVSGIGYWTFSGIVFNPEPRYAVYSGLCFLTICVILVDQISGIRKFSWTIHGFSMLIILTWIFSWTPTDFRTEGATWKSQLVDARAFCEKEKSATFDFVTMPYNWELAISCSKVRKF